jgi:hypothetical protein
MPEYLIPHMLGLWIEKRALRRMFGSKERKREEATETRITRNIIDSIARQMLWNDAAN